MKPKLFVPFNVRNKIINEDGNKKKDISKLAYKYNYSTLTSYMSEKKIYNAFIKRRYDGVIKNVTNNFGISYDNFKKGINDSIKDIKYTLEHPFTSLNCGFIINSNRFPSTPFDDTELKAYWKFNELSGNIINQSESAADLGSAADLIVTGATYGVAGKLGTALSFDGINDYALAGSSLSQWNYAHSTTATSTVVAWVLSDVEQTEKVIFDDSIALQGGGTTVQAGFTFDLRTVRELSYIVRNTAGQEVTRLVTTGNIYPDNTNYFMVSVTYDHNLASDNAKIAVNDGTKQTATKSANIPTNGNATGIGTLAARARLNTGFLNGNLDEFSMWGKVMSDSDITTLYNSGSGKEIY